MGRSFMPDGLVCANVVVILILIAGRTMAVAVLAYAKSGTTVLKASKIGHSLTDIRKMLHAANVR